MNIIEMARQAGFSTGTRDWADGNGGFKYAAPLATGNCLVELEAFAKLIAEKAAAKEREECAKECERMVMYPNAKQESAAHQNVWAAAKAIRARGQA
jgi:hypothetical protein